MYKIQVQGKTIRELRKSLIEMADSIVTKEEQELNTSIGDENGYEGNIPATVPQPLGNVMNSSLANTMSFPVPTSSPLPIASEISSSISQLSPAEVAFKSGQAIAAESVAPTIDARGLPWDIRIHASSKALTKDGTWRYKRGVEQAEINSVEQELTMKKMGSSPAPGIPSVPAPIAAIPSAAAPSPFGAPPASPFGTPPAYIPATPAVAPAPVAPMTPTLPSIPQQQMTPAHSFETFKSNLIPLFSDLINRGKINQEWVEKVKAGYGLKEIWDLANNPQAAQEVFNGFVEYGFITKVG